MVVMSFDLSTNCIGVVTAEIDDISGKIIRMKSCPIIPRKFNPETLGYLKSKKYLKKRNEIKGGKNHKIRRKNYKRKSKRY